MYGADVKRIAVVGRCVGFLIKVNLIKPASLFAFTRERPMLINVSSQNCIEQSINSILQEDIQLV